MGKICPFFLKDLAELCPVPGIVRILKYIQFLLKFSSKIWPKYFNYNFSSVIPIQEPDVYSDVHVSFFRDALVAIEQRINSTEIHEHVVSDVNSHYCGIGRVPTGSFDVGFEEVPTKP